MNLAQYGWNARIESQFNEYAGSGLVPARINCQQKNLYQIYTECGELTAEVSGKMLHTAESRRALPVIGDWVAVQMQPGHDRAIIHAILPRNTYFSRAAAGSGKRRNGSTAQEQPIAANVDTVFLVSGLDREFNLRRIERYVTLAYNSGANPVIVLNKADLSDDLEECLAEVESIAFGIPVHAISARDHAGMEELNAYLRPGETIALLGSSGVGKSTLINTLLGYERQHVREISTQVGKGQHTTTYRELILLPSGGLLMDTPGMRELQLWGEDTDVQSAFDDIDALARHCRFRDCEHTTEPGCAVQAALEAGTLDPARFQSYLKLKKEVEFQEQRQFHSTDYIKKQKWMPIIKMMKNKG